MHKRFLAITVLGVAFLFSQGGSFLIAALCPHLRSAQVSCDTHHTGSAMSHDNMGNMPMDSVEESASNPDPNAVALGQPVELCSHCMMHTRITANAITLREIEASKLSGNYAIPDSVPAVVSVEMPSVAILNSRAHGPPGQTTPRHVLINIFRI